MPMITATELESVLAACSESADLDFKERFDPSKARDWVELVKDLIAMANSGGGTVIIGVDDDGKPVSDIPRKLDPADIVNRVSKYVGRQFGAVESVVTAKANSPVLVIRVGSSPLPMVFIKPGTFEESPGQQRTAFAQGSLYFRHGAKSETAAAEDLPLAFERLFQERRAILLEGIAKVVEAPVGTKVVVVPDQITENRDLVAGDIRLVNDPSAPTLFGLPIDSTHPFRLKEVVEQLNAKLRGTKQVTSHHVQCIRVVHKVNDNRRFCLLQRYASPKYSKGFVDWIMEQYNIDSKFFEKTKTQYDAIRTGPS